MHQPRKTAFWEVVFLGWCTFGARGGFFSAGAHSVHKGAAAGEKNRQPRRCYEDDSKGVCPLLNHASWARTFSSERSSRGIGRTSWKIMPASSTNATTVHTPKFPSTKSSQSWLMMRPTHQAKTHW